MHVQRAWLAVLVRTVSLLLFLGYTLSSLMIERQVRASPVFCGESMLRDRFTDTATGRQVGS